MFHDSFYDQVNTIICQAGTKICRQICSFQFTYLLEKKHLKNTIKIHLIIHCCHENLQLEFSAFIYCHWVHLEFGSYYFGMGFSDHIGKEEYIVNYFMF